MPVPNYIKRWREAHKVTASELADAIGTHQTTISKWETRTNEVSDDFKLKLAKYFHVPVAALFDYGYEPTADALRRTIEVVTSLHIKVDRLQERLDESDRERMPA